MTRCGEGGYACGRVRPGEPYKPGVDCRTCWQAYHVPGVVNFGRERAIRQEYEPRPAAAIKVMRSNPPDYPGNRRKFTREGPGDKLKKLLASVNLHPTGDGCGCEDMAAKMNDWGVEGCKENRESIIRWLVVQRDKTKWLAQGAAMVAAVTSGLVFKLNPLDPIPGLVDEAIRLAEVPPPGSIVTLDASRLADGISFNCSMVRYKSKLLFAYRTGWAGSQIHVCELGRDLQPITESVTLHRLYQRPWANYGREDPRLFVFRDRLHVSYVGVEGRRGRIVTHQLYARLTDDLQVEEAFAPESPDPNRWQKNWSFFGHDGALYAIYGIRPHVVLAIDGNRIGDRFETPNSLPWSGGYLRGGAPPALVDGLFYHFFHGAHDLGPDWPLRRYNVGAYTFEPKPPFRIVQQTPEPIDAADPSTRPDGQYADVLFPGGAIIEDGRTWRVAHGVHDRWSEIRSYSHADIRRRLS